MRRMGTVPRALSDRRSKRDRVFRLSRALLRHHRRSLSGNPTQRGTDETGVCESPNGKRCEAAAY
ncbi:hypothetical protein W02_02170 [Nitrospira sp. KM1]|nr:hypothetical protein W02_02170 [Nitrospira sp. KM1]